jgi:TP901 family phage tail tape measure protein
MPASGFVGELGIRVNSDTGALDATSGAMNDVASNMFLMQKAGFAAAASIGSLMTGIGAGLTAVLGAAIASFGTLQKQMRQVQRIAGMTSGKLETLRARFIEVSGALPVSADKMAKVATNAARLGIRGTENITRFSKTMVAMANTTNLMATEATDTIGRMATQFDIAFKNANKIASGIAKISTTTTSTASDLARFGERVGALSKEFGISVGEMLAFGGMADEAGLRARTAATQFGKLINRMTTQTAEFERLIPTIDNLSEQLNKSATPAILDLFEGLRKMKTTKAQKVMDELTIASQRMAPFMNTLMSNVGELKEQIETGNEAVAEGTFLMKSYQTAINNVIDDARTLIGTFSNITKVIGGTLAPIARVIIQALNAMGQAFLQLPSIVQGAVGLLIGLSGVLLLITGIFMTMAGLIGIMTVGLRGFMSAILGTKVAASELLPYLATFAGKITSLASTGLSMFTTSMASAKGAILAFGQQLKYLGNASGFQFLTNLGAKMQSAQVAIANYTTSIGTLVTMLITQLGFALSFATSRLTIFFNALAAGNMTRATNALLSMAKGFKIVGLRILSSLKILDRFNYLFRVINIKANRFLSNMMSRFPLFASVVNAVSTAFYSVSGAIGSFLGVAGTALGPVIATVVLFTAAFFVLKDIIIAVWNQFTSAFSAMFDWIGALVNGLQSGVISTFDAFFDAIGRVVDMIGALLSSFIPASEGAGGLASAFRMVGKVIGFVLTSVLWPLTFALDIIATTLNILAVMVRSFLAPIFEMMKPLVKPFNELKNAFFKLGKSLGFLGDAKDEFGAMDAVVKTLANSMHYLGSLVATFLVPPVELVVSMIESVAWAIREISSWTSNSSTVTGRLNKMSDKIGRASQQQTVSNLKQAGWEPEQKLGTGGLVTQPTSAVVAENGPEAVLPLDKLDEIINQSGQSQIVIENNVNLDGRTVTKIVKQYEGEDEVRNFNKPKMGVV